MAWVLHPPPPGSGGKTQAAKSPAATALSISKSILDGVYNSIGEVFAAGAKVAGRQVILSLKSPLRKITQKHLTAKDAPPDAQTPAVLEAVMGIMDDVFRCVTWCVTHGQHANRVWRPLLVCLCTPCAVGAQSVRALLPRGARLWQSLEQSLE